MAKLRKTLKAASFFQQTGQVILRISIGLLVVFNYFQKQKNIMKKSLLTLGAFLLLGLSSMAQVDGKDVAKQLQECACDEIIMISGAVEKKYTASWLENISYENGFVVFSKGSQKHQWNSEKIIFIEKSGAWVRVYLQQTR